MRNAMFWFHFCLVLFQVWYGVSVPLVNIDIWAEGHNFINKGNIGNFSDNPRFSRVLNFFPVPVEEECNANDGRRKGICMNTYECKMKGGKSYGFCAHGFGVCCIFTSTCNQEISYNLTYFVNPDFPDLTRQMTSCSLTVLKMDDDIAQLRFDFIHFNLGQPNRQTGVCEEDIFILTSGLNNRDITLCGFNSGQHVYFDVENTNGLVINMNLSRKAVTRLWEIRVTQIPFSQRAPAGCLQYYEGSVGTIQTMNFADNGRHLANQEYNICIRQEEGMCSIAYEQCHENSFRISPNTGGDNENVDVGSGDGAVINETELNPECNDGITIPCDSDELLLDIDENMIPGTCSLIYCGSSLCSMGEDPCRIESTTAPFIVGVNFGENLKEDSPDDNLGMCLTYEQLPCNV